MSISVDTEADARFERLQDRLRYLWPVIRTWSDVDQTVIALPSYSIDARVLEHVEPLLRAYEERFLYLLLLLRQQRCRIVFVTSLPVRPALVDAYLRLVPNVNVEDARSRLVLVSADDPARKPLAEKLLGRDDVVAQVEKHLPDRSRAHIAAFTVSEAERDLALRLGVPIYGAAPRHAALGTKSGCRRLFAAVGVRHPAGESVSTGDEAIAALQRLAAAGRSKGLVKLDEGVSGFGNAIVELHGRAGEIARRARSSASEVLDRLAEQGGVVEELIDVPGTRSPSVQLRITPFGDVEVLSTHDQLLGGPIGQTYVGCRFPADRSYAAAITLDAVKVADRLAAEGVQGRFAIDFVVAPHGDSWESYAIEINLRKGGTTHPFLTMQFLTDGTYDPVRAEYVTPDGRRRYYVAADGLGNARLKNVSPEAVLDCARRNRIAYDSSRQSGAVFHMLSALPVHGTFGLTAICDTPEEADALRDRSVALVEGLTA